MTPRTYTVVNLLTDEVLSNLTIESAYDMLEVYCPNPTPNQRRLMHEGVLFTRDGRTEAVIIID